MRTMIKMKKKIPEIIMKSGTIKVNICKEIVMKSRNNLPDKA